MTPIQLTIPEIFEATAAAIQAKIDSSSDHRDLDFTFQGACIELGRVIYGRYFVYEPESDLKRHPAYKVFAALYKRPSLYWFGDRRKRENQQVRVHALLLAAEFSRDPANLKGIL